MRNNQTIRVSEIAHHRNGICGAPFYVVLFTAKLDVTHQFIATVFSERGVLTVLDRTMLASDVIEFGVNSWRGDDFEPALRAAIETYETANSSYAPAPFATDAEYARFVEAR